MVMAQYGSTASQCMSTRLIVIALLYRILEADHPAANNGIVGLVARAKKPHGVAFAERAGVALRDTWGGAVIMAPQRRAFNPGCRLEGGEFHSWPGSAS